MNRFLLILLAVVITLPAAAQNLSKRIIHNDPQKYRQMSSVHAGAGQMGFTGLIGSQDMNTNFLYLHAGVIQPKGGIGHHFHHTIEEMYVVLNGEAEYTINGRTAKLKGPVAVPCKMGDSHAVYNSSDEPLRWLNFAVSTTKGQGDNFDLADDRVGATIDPKPVFVYGDLKATAGGGRGFGGNPYGGEGVKYRRVLRPDVFSTSWNHVDHVVIPAGVTTTPRQLVGIEEVYYVMKGSGKYTVGKESAAIGSDDAFTGLLGEEVSFANTGNEDLEILVIGVAIKGDKNPNRFVPPSQPKAMVLQMDFVVAKENAEAFEKMYHSIYVPAMTVQQGYLGSKLLRFYPENLAKEIESEATTYNYQIQISFDTEASRRKWVASDQHQIAWPAATKLAKSYKWRGYDVMGDDNQ